MHYQNASQHLIPDLDVIHISFFPGKPMNESSLYLTQHYICMDVIQDTRTGMNLSLSDASETRIAMHPVILEMFNLIKAPLAMTLEVL